MKRFAFVLVVVAACRPAQQGSQLREEESLRRDDRRDERRQDERPAGFTEAAREQGGEKLGCACAKTPDGSQWEAHVYYATSERAGYKVRIAPAGAFQDCMADKEANAQCAL